jgi:hypothetical protein
MAQLQGTVGTSQPWDPKTKPAKTKPALSGNALGMGPQRDKSVRRVAGSAGK